MQILRTTEQATELVWRWRCRDASVGLVPTMGALHEGHLSLARTSVGRCDHTVTTIFVNPTQFAPHEDLSRYPRTLDADLEGLRREGVSAVFVPESDEIYPPGFSTSVQPPSVAQSLEGEFRPTHFQGVATVVLKLFHILPTTHAFFGQKDYQQLCVIRAMVRDLNVPIEIVACPTVRETDGLAMSSRNRYLNAEERIRALRLFAALDAAEQAVRDGQRDAAEIERIMQATLSADGPEQGVDSIDYAKLVDSQTLQPIPLIHDRAVALIAAKVGSTRLIDNRLIDP
ncbi:pantoate--beta-alanine ligase [Stieleria sp. ICT_E10.1]|uniref:pantoate--beta-alanine ligase n=1 Tax=Stieleria sedimenti TaxID=2976331 RepID=UPI0021803DD5|nr:pantoate--beta-alanine ligase [Stieleria sedimenti]MCS7469516.1 pantoate--beta-alanine ligase [Stieleria sedimenti]